jgi:hypothetical protein
MSRAHQPNTLLTDGAHATGPIHRMDSCIQPVIGGRTGGEASVSRVREAVYLLPALLPGGKDADIAPSSHSVEPPNTETTFYS